MCTNVEDSSTHEQTTVDSLSLEEEYWDEEGWDVGYSEVVAVLGTAEAWSEPLATDGEKERTGITLTLTNQHVALWVYIYVHELSKSAYNNQINNMHTHRH